VNSFCLRKGSFRNDIIIHGDDTNVATFFKVITFTIIVIIVIIVIDSESESVVSAKGCRPL
jgi:hypothetical protein